MSCDYCGKELDQDLESSSDFCSNRCAKEYGFPSTRTEMDRCYRIPYVKLWIGLVAAWYSFLVYRLFSVYR